LPDPECFLAGISVEGFGDLGAGIFEDFGSADCFRGSVSECGLSGGVSQDVLNIVKGYGFVVHDVWSLGWLDGSVYLGRVSSEKGLLVRLGILLSRGCVQNASTSRFFLRVCSVGVSAVIAMVLGFADFLRHKADQAAGEDRDECDLDESDEMPPRSARRWCSTDG
jgi:hypothetical protein